ncbi:aromatic-ring-hydroxylating dioxygenase subunit beta [Brevibacillus sp. NRS-1366]|uniref:aromatic-ring-hydroxylating dioxygenase subunit beta n=1 Tax=Brevibacillus sp. NRS-1366 TaxID=3233899 RepID=UPI003D1F5B43
MTTKVIEKQQIEEFLYKEAALLDQGKWDEWLGLLTSDVVYWVPCNGYDNDPMKHVSIIYDDRERMEERIWRLQSGQSPAQLPPSRTCHLITNVGISDFQGDKIVVSSNFMIAELRRGAQTIYAGRYEHHLKQEGNNWKISYKKIELLNNSEPLGNLSFIL